MQNNPDQKNNGAQKWGSQLGFIFAASAATIGLGNVWRFPYLAGENGGGAFIIAYIAAVLLLGIPLMIMELSAGSIKAGGPVKTFKKLTQEKSIFGWLVVGLTILVMSYYLVLTGWTLSYALQSLGGEIQSFADFRNGYGSLSHFLIVSALTAFVIANGIKAIERLSKLLMPLFFVVILGLTAYSLTLPGNTQALSFLFTPNFNTLLSPKLWILAIGQAFYSLGVGQGVLITYGSFLPKSVDLPRSIGAVAIFETGVALLSGLMIFPLVFSFGLNPAQGSELAFTVLPAAFANIPAGQILAILFFWLLFLAAISSSIAGMEVIKTTIREEFKLSNLWATATAFLLILVPGILSALSFTPAKTSLMGRPFLEALDLFAANQVAITLGLIGGLIIINKLSTKEIISKFNSEDRSWAGHIIFTARYLWIIVFGILILDLIIK
jgi:NSS family neurotransmitter:Na+ symporter